MHRGWPMNPLSSRATFFYKRVFPVLWFGFLVAFIVGPWLGGGRTGSFSQLPFFIIPVGMIVFGFFLFRKLVFDLVDEVLDDGNALVVRNRGEEDRIALADITNVSYSPMMSPPRVTLSLRRPSAFGSQVTFCAPLRVFGFATSNPVIDGLIERIDAARRARGS